MSDSMYDIGIYVHYVKEGCLAQVVKIRRSIGALTRYDLLLDTGEIEEYVDEIHLYPQRKYPTRPVEDDTFMAFKLGQVVDIPTWQRQGVVRAVAMLDPPLGTGRDFMYTVDLVYVHYVKEGCLAQVVKIRRSIGALTRYDLLLDTGEIEEYVDEIHLYPQRKYPTRPVEDDTFMAFKLGQVVDIPTWQRQGVVRAVAMLDPPLGTGRDFMYTVELPANRAKFMYDFFTCELKAL